MKRGDFLLSGNHAVKKEIKFGFRKTCKLVYQYTRKKITEQIKVVSVIITYLILFQTIILKIPIADSALIATGIVLVITGLTFFMEGLLLCFMPLGEAIGTKLPQKAKLAAIISFAFILGLVATFAEPVIGALRMAGSRVTAWDAPLLFLLLNRYVEYLVYSIGIGVGVAVLFGMLRFLYGWSLKPFIYILVSLLTAISLYAYLHPNLRHILGLAWDCGAVTTGPVTVPLILALGIGVSRFAGKISSKSGNFGVVSLASLFPIIAVLIIGMINLSRVPLPMGAEEFFSKKNQPKAAVLFSDLDSMKGYALKNADHKAQLALFENSRDKMAEYLKKINENKALTEKLFGNREAFHSWAVKKGTQNQQLAVFQTQDNLREAVNTYKVRGERLADFNKVEFLKRNSINAVRAIMPLSFFLFFILLVLREKLPRADEIILGLVFALIGMAVFRGGLEIGLSRVGDQVGKNLPATYTAIEIPSEEKIIQDFKPEFVNTAFTAEGEKTEFFYIKQNEEYLSVPFKEEYYQKDDNIYRYIPTRGPLFGSEGKNIPGLLVVLAFAFIMGYGATLAEPGLNALGIAVEETTIGTLKKSLLIQAVAIGVGVGVSAGIAKIIWNLPLFWMLVPVYMILLLITGFSTEEFVNIGWDSAGATTGPVTVPLVLSVGLSIGSQVGAVEGFGILALASAWPILSVLIVGLYINNKRKAVLNEAVQEEAGLTPGGEIG
jgi:hypothetical protein